MSDETRFDRIEDKLDKLSEAVVAIARAEEKLITLEKDRNLLLEKMSSIDKRVQSLEATQSESKGLAKFTMPIIISIVTAIFISFIGKHIQ